MLVRYTVKWGWWLLIILMVLTGAAVMIFFDGSRTADPRLLTISGMAVGVLLAVPLYLMAVARREATGIALEMTAKLRQFKLAVENASSHIIIADIDGKIIYANKAVETITGYSQAEIIGNNPRLWGGQMAPEFYKNLWHRIKEEKLPFKGEIVNRRKNGESYTALVTISPILDENKILTGFVGLEDDISQKIKYEEQLQRQTKELAEEKSKGEAVIASIGEGVVVVDKEGKILLANATAQKLLGWGMMEMMGKNYKDIWMVKDSLGNTIVDSHPVQRVLESGKNVASGEYFYTRKDGREFPVFLTIAPLIRDGVVMGAVDVFRDISQEKAVDRAKTEFVALASHQLRTPLSAVNWYVEMLLGGGLGALDARQKKYLDEIYEANRRMVELVNALLNVSRIDLGTFAIEPEEMSVVETVKKVVEEMKPQIVFKKLRLAEEYGEDIPLLSADPKLLRMIVQNIISNAVKYTSEGGLVGVAVKKVRRSEVVGRRVAEFDGILFKVIDNGMGIPEDQKNKIFSKLFRADNVKEKETEGSGLGLYVVQAVIKAISGSIWFESAEGKGSTFYVVLPFSGMPRRTSGKQPTSGTIFGQ